MPSSRFQSLKILTFSSVCHPSDWVPPGLNLFRGLKHGCLLYLGDKISGRFTLFIVYSYSNFRPDTRYLAALLRTPNGSSCKLGITRPVGSTLFNQKSDSLYMFTSSYFIWNLNILMSHIEEFYFSSIWHSHHIRHENANVAEHWTVVLVSHH